jgi:VanZ family protein
VTEIIAPLCTGIRIPSVNGSDRSGDGLGTPSGTKPVPTAALRALAPLALMGLIFFLSAQQDLDSGLGAWDEVLRTLAHATEYGGLALLWVWALGPITARAVPIGVAITLLYAVSDEYHQTFVATRAGTATDLVVDAAGVAVAIVVLRYHARVRAAVLAGPRGQ